jgi:hypothetical protein
VFSVHPEVRLCAWGGATLLSTAAGIVLKNNLHRIGPLVLATVVAAIAIACYAFVAVRRRRGRASLVDDSVLLLGALLVSADVAFIETQFHLFGAAWYRHLLLLAVVHGAGAYAYRSRALLTLALTALCGWLGVTNAGFDNPFDSAGELALRAFGAAAVVLMWRAVDLRFRHSSEFAPVFESFAAGLAAIAGWSLMTYDRTRTAACLFALIIGAAIAGWGYWKRRELFVICGFLYGVVAVDVLFIDFFQEACVTFLLLLVSMIGAMWGLFAIHARFRELRA